MPPSQQIGAYADISPILDLALERQGLRIEFSSYGKAMQFRHRCNRYRALLRSRQQKQLGEDVVTSTPYDCLCLSVGKNETTVRISVRGTENYKIKTLDGEEVSLTPQQPTRDETNLETSAKAFALTLGIPHE